MSAVYRLPGLWYFVTAARTDSERLPGTDPNSANRVKRSLIRRIQGYSHTTRMLLISQTTAEQADFLRDPEWEE